MPASRLPAAVASPGRPAATGATGTVGEALAIAPDTYVVPGRWSSGPDGPGLLVATLVVRGRTSAIVDTAPAPLGPDWIAAVLALVDPTDVRWIVATGRDPARTGCLGPLVTACPRATVVLPGSGCAELDLDDGPMLLHEGATAPAPTTPGRSLPDPPGPVGRSDAPAGERGRAVGARAADAVPSTTAQAAPVSSETDPDPVAGPGRFAVELPRNRLLWTDAVGGATHDPPAHAAGRGVGPGLPIDAARWTDDDLVELLSTRDRPLRPGELDAIRARAPRVLASPCGPLARAGPGVDRLLRLAAEAERDRTVRAGRTVAALHRALDAEPRIVGGPPVA